MGMEVEMEMGMEMRMEKEIDGDGDGWRWNLDRTGANRTDVGLHTRGRRQVEQKK